MDITTVYYGTTLDNLKKILNDGFINEQDIPFTDPDFIPEELYNLVYLGSNKRDCLLHAGLNQLPNTSKDKIFPVLIELKFDPTEYGPMCDKGYVGYLLVNQIDTFKQHLLAADIIRSLDIDVNVLINNVDIKDICRAIPYKESLLNGKTYGLEDKFMVSKPIPIDIIENICLYYDFDENSHVTLETIDINGLDKAVDDTYAIYNDKYANNQLSYQ